MHITILKCLDVTFVSVGDLMVLMFFEMGGVRLSWRRAPVTDMVEMT